MGDGFKGPPPAFGVLPQQVGGERENRLPQLVGEVPPQSLAIARGDGGP
jgi:hypothetical protein